MSDLIDTTEMYLRTIYELGEEGVVPMRARIAERLHQSGPTVSQTVARMERDGLVLLAGDRHLELTPLGRAAAVRVMRKHRLAERLLFDLIGLDWDLVHEEACRWEHVVSDAVERRIVGMLSYPVDSPYGNPIPGLAELGVEHRIDDVPRLPSLAELLPHPADTARVHASATVPGRAGGSVGAGRTSAGAVGTPEDPMGICVDRFSEHLQTDPHLLRLLHESGIVPGTKVRAFRTGATIALVPDGNPGCELDQDAAALVFAHRVDADR